ncbi:MULTISPECIES: ComF family protein [Enterococcaceae]|uniref:ComF family protein n=1 Tax=Enterococcaceae TaxID=81852 RepID=UPI000E478D5A|nr:MULTISPECIES: ComF family protein [Enterococcaceae]MCI0129589.1 ComF family protein [Vagococcus sp. CY53-2]RGI31756.1 ComF family protein [Melissococcus sp. OM08-11BH]UNM90235.1 ComF family protein [Vagococcus sp. CY52-2]
MKCVLCHGVLKNQVTFRELLLGSQIKNHCCDKCHSQFQPINPLLEKRCIYCRKVSRETVCEDCLYWEKNQIILEPHHALYEYNESMSEFMTSYKFQGNRTLAKAFSSDINQVFKQLTYDMVIPIPLSKKRLADRGFHQVETLLEDAYVDYESILKKRRHTRKQSGKTKEERLKTIHPFYLNQSDQDIIYQKTIILVDDVYTTGSTILQAKRYLLSKHAKKVITFSLAR